ncbi:hypothetical protein KL933_000066 [Ogataea haglerorum]|uniref:Cell wall mannoprotein PIR1-like C-terminal domain-containing protein n=1 Tax=Ogataea haglerorum TaxID=1937702 RepID=A0AAN6D979_9ASCO|nr:hypothetical protein KL913_000700 [Ogataea haglerorum]KAG7723020.1 hypothetical protein KL949_000070 [Ogataea haglerorum]KAG7730271.1 hypothetical protein KL933_000066 [Ogataea haglerorum]KAG7745035.1 hypothetical protein KL932_000065 [Ogataea haglerorum]KAG7768783.1 hypothetical protein KL946_000066 [Ogataea haglerorum]
MKFSAAIFAAGAIAAYVPSEPWSTLTPSATLESATTDYTKTFGIAINKVTSASGAKAKRDVVTQIGDGQIQATTATASTAAVVTQIGDGQIQATTATPETAAPVVTQIGDGQIQATTATPKTAAPVVTQIGDGQIQATTATPKTAAPVVTQIGDGQIQATTATETTAPVVTQIGDGQIQATTATSAHESVVSQIGDGQVQATTATSSVASQITDGQVQASSTAAADDPSSSIPTSCKSDEALAMTLKDGILTDSKGRIGSIVANRQFQFDGPPPQAGAIYAAGWAISPEGYLAIGNTTTFYQCLSGTFYNLYDESIGGQCEPVHLSIVDLVSC